MKITNIELGMPTRRRGLKRLRIAFGILAAFRTSAVFAQQRVETVVTNRKILTVDADFRVRRSARNQRRSYRRTRHGRRGGALCGSNTRITDVKGATVIPGLIDNHFHFTRAVGRWHQQARFESLNSRREVLRILAAKAASLKPGDWIMVQGGWTARQSADAPGGFTLEELDGVALKNPLFVQESYSLVYANSLALKAVGLNPSDGARRNAAGLCDSAPPCPVRCDGAGLSRPARPKPLRPHAELNAAGLTGVYAWATPRS